jgi:hypothetical protein
VGLLSIGSLSEVTQVLRFDLLTKDGLAMYNALLSDPAFTVIKEKSERLPATEPTVVFDNNNKMHVVRPASAAKIYCIVKVVTDRSNLKKLGAFIYHDPVQPPTFYPESNTADDKLEPRNIF